MLDLAAEIKMYNYEDITKVDETDGKSTSVHFLVFAEFLALIDSDPTDLADGNVKGDVFIEKYCTFLYRKLDNAISSI